MADLKAALTDEQCSLWYCADCRASGALAVAGATVYEVVSAVEREHRGRSPECTAPFGALRVVRPNSWFADSWYQTQTAGHAMGAGAFPPGETNVPAEAISAPANKPRPPRPKRKR